MFQILANTILHCVSNYQNALLQYSWKQGRLARGQSGTGSQGMEAFCKNYLGEVHAKRKLSDMDLWRMGWKIGGTLSKMMQKYRQGFRLFQPNVAILRTKKLSSLSKTEAETLEEESR